MLKHPLFERITIIGLGLIGSSVARAIREHHLATTIVGCDRNEVSLAYARKHGFIDIAADNAKSAVEESDLVLIATPPSSLEAIAKAIAPALQPGSIVMDVCSVKLPAIAAIAPNLPVGVHFIPAHPIAGSEHSGISAGRSDLFARKRIIITPDNPELIGNVIEKASNFWKAMDARVEAMPAHLHDMVYAYVSHLPQLLAFAAGSVLEEYAENANEDELLSRFLRLSHSPADMWIDIFLSNKENLVKALNRYLDALTHIQKELSDAPEEIVSRDDKILARTALFPRVASSCLITTVMEAEKKAGFHFARYAGTGFADFTYPASQSPEGDIESISNQYQAVVEILDEYIARLQTLTTAIDSGDAEDML